MNASENILTQTLATCVSQLPRLGTEELPLQEALQRICAVPVHTDRPSPACTVSAMDGYALPEGITFGTTLPVQGEIVPGMPPPAMPAHGVLKIFTGAAVPATCAGIIPREQVQERGHEIHIPADTPWQPGQHLRHQGENAMAGEEIVAPGQPITPPLAACLSAFGYHQVPVFKRLKVRTIVTGNEISLAESGLQPWQLRDSNGPTLAALLAHLPWIHWRDLTHAGDQRAVLHEQIRQALQDSDTLLLTGGVSAGDYDFVPAVLQELHCQILFKSLPIRPGKPILGALGPQGQLVLGLPGNPAAVLTTARRLGVPLLRYQAGFAQYDPPTPVVELLHPDKKSLPLHWFRPVRFVGPGQVELVPNRGSGDIIGPARSAGFIEIYPGELGPGPWPFYRWSVES